MYGGYGPDKYEEPFEGSINVIQESISAIENDALRLVKTDPMGRSFDYMYDYQNIANANFNKKAVNIKNLITDKQR